VFAYQPLVFNWSLLSSN